MSGAKVEREQKDAIASKLRRFSADTAHYAPMLQRVLVELREWVRLELSRRGYSHTLILNLFRVEISDDGLVVWEDPELADQPAHGGVINGHPIRWLAMQGQWSIRDHPNAPLPEGADPSDMKDEGRLLFNVCDLNRLPLTPHSKLRSQVERLTAYDLQLVKLAALVEDEQAAKAVDTINRLWSSIQRTEARQKTLRGPLKGGEAKKQAAAPKHEEWKRLATESWKLEPNLSPAEVIRRIQKKCPVPRRPDKPDFSGSESQIRRIISPLKPA